MRQDAGRRAGQRGVDAQGQPAQVRPGGGRRRPSRGRWRRGPRCSPGRAGTGFWTRKASTAGSALNARTAARISAWLAVAGSWRWGEGMPDGRARLVLLADVAGAGRVVADQDGAEPDGDALGGQVGDARSATSAMTASTTGAPAMTTATSGAHRANSVPELALAGEDHGQALLVGGGDSFGVADAAPRLDHDGHARAGRPPRPRRGTGRSRRWRWPRPWPGRRPCGRRSRPASTRLCWPAPMPTAWPAVHQHDGVGLGVAAQPPRQLGVGATGRRWATPW